MFYYISGKLALVDRELDRGIAVIDAGGIGYKLTVSGTTLDRLPPYLSVSESPDVKLYTYMSVREDDVELFGFSTLEELSSFKMLISVSGVGPKVALSVLSLLTPEKFAMAVCSEDQKAISKASGVGAKTAARIILELKDKLMKSSLATSATMDSAVTKVNNNVSNATSRSKISEAQDALTVLGYNRMQINSALSSIDVSSLSLEEIIKAALKKLV
jgi:Holliday junction DNA helicase RuvA